uniref:Triacylglycerol lipase n=2 Tax=Xenopus tropicalis TaxID=8364 RepID=A0A7D9NM11_XENTR
MLKTCKLYQRISRVQKAHFEVNFAFNVMFLPFVFVFLQSQFSHSTLTRGMNNLARNTGGIWELIQGALGGRKFPAAPLGAQSQMFYVLGLISFLLPSVQGLEEICYEEVGCFPVGFPWAGTRERPEGGLPWSPKMVNTRFLLFTRDNADHFQEINSSTISDSYFQTTRKTRFIIHGFIDVGTEGWVPDMCNAMLSVEDINCLSTDWSDGSHTDYVQAANNVRVVGAEVADLVKTLRDDLGYSPSLVHVIGHSLGAHAAGEAGKRMPGIGRITGLDPAQPYFQDTPEEVRLDPSDATLVDVIHTDSAPFIPSLGLGTGQLSGHLDFFPNGGIQMPGCKQKEEYNISDIFIAFQGKHDDLVCNHLRSYRYYMESITTPSGFTGFPAASYESFSSGAGFPCPANECPVMGHYADLYSGATPSSQTYYLNTGDSPPFARWRYKVTVHISVPVSVLGSVWLSLLGLNGKTKMHDIYSGRIQPKQTHTAFIDAETKVGPLVSAHFIWSSRNEAQAKSVTVEFGGDGTRYYSCGFRAASVGPGQIVPLCNRAAGPRDQ